MEEEYKQVKLGEKGAWLSIAAYLLLTAVKLTVGYVAASQALWADGLNNASDVIASIAVLVGLRISQIPPDHNHRYGHFRAETIAALTVSLIMVAIGLQVLYQAIASFFEQSQVIPDMTAGWTAVGCAIVMTGVYLYNRRLGKEINSKSLMAAAKDNLSDALVSIGAFIGIVAAQFGLSWMDPLAAVIVGLIICRTAWGIFREAAHDLTDGFDDEQLAQMKITIGKTQGVVSVRDLKARVHGNKVWVDVTIEVEGALRVHESHRISDEIEARLRNHHRIGEVLVHIEPAHVESAHAASDQDQGPSTT